MLRQYHFYYSPSITNIVQIVCDILPFNHIVDDQDFQRCITLPIFDILFDVSQYDNLIFKPLKHRFVTINNNVYIPPYKPLSCKYLLPYEYNDIISLNDLSILHVYCRSMHNFRNFNNSILYLKLFAQSFAIIAIKETWLLDNDALQSYEINNYNLFIKNRQKY